MPTLGIPWRLPPKSELKRILEASIADVETELRSALSEVRLARNALRRGDAKAVAFHADGILVGASLAHRDAVRAGTIAGDYRKA